MREITDHKTNAANGELTVTAIDEPGSGGAHHQYRITGFAYPEAPTKPVPETWPGEMAISFQNGPIKESGINGLTQEILLAIVIDRLRCFQSGPYSTKANACALTHCEEALHWLQQRTLERMRRGVEGTHTV